MLLQQRVKLQLEQREKLGLLRQAQTFKTVNASRLILDEKEFINYCSNDYLGIATDSSQNTMGLSGAMASPLVTGHSAEHRELEEALLQWVDAPKSHKCILFSSGFAANTGVIRALFAHSKGNALLLQDKLNHASLLDAGTVCQALGVGKQFRFKHNDFSDLDKQIRRFDAANKLSLAVTEGIFSMDGDAPDLSAMVKTCELHNIPWMLDDAHGVGVLGSNGAGSLSEQGIAVERCNILVLTFGKAIGAQGAAVIADEDIIDYLVNFSKEYIYSTHLSPIQAVSALKNIRKVQNESHRREVLQNNITYFRQQMSSTNWSLMESRSPIQPILIGDESEAMWISEKLKNKGLWVNAMRYPTVAKNKARLRVTITSHHGKEDIDKLVEALND